MITVTTPSGTVSQVAGQLAVTLDRQDKENKEKARKAAEQEAKVSICRTLILDRNSFPARSSSTRSKTRCRSTRPRYSCSEPCGASSACRCGRSQATQCHHPSPKSAHRSFWSIYSFRCSIPCFWGSGRRCPSKGRNASARSRVQPCHIFCQQDQESLQL